MTGTHRFVLAIAGMLFVLAALGIAAGVVGFGAIVIVVAFTVTTTLLGAVAMLTSGGADAPTGAARSGSVYLTPAEREAADIEALMVARARVVLDEGQSGPPPDAR